jgi:hypothetical protein
VVGCLIQIIENFSVAFITDAVRDTGKAFIQKIAVLLADLHTTPTADYCELHRQSPLLKKLLTLAQRTNTRSSR